jgi:shikimate 5-dehydrogenase
VHGAFGIDLPVDYVLAASTDVNDAAVSAAPAGSLVVNATGLGKDAPGSPLGPGARFPAHGLAWELNYRGDLVFLDQALAQAQDRELVVEDGWTYFLHGWTQVIAEVFDLTIPTDGPRFQRLSELAGGAPARAIG